MIYLICIRFVCNIPPAVCSGRPLPLETTASEEMTIIDNMALFEKNGFRFKVTWRV